MKEAPKRTDVLNIRFLRNKSKIVKFCKKHKMTYPAWALEAHNALEEKYKTIEK